MLHGNRMLASAGTLPGSWQRVMRFVVTGVSTICICPVDSQPHSLQKHSAEFPHFLVINCPTPGRHKRFTSGGGEQPFLLEHHRSLSLSNQLGPATSQRSNTILGYQTPNGETLVICLARFPWGPKSCQVRFRGWCGLLATQLGVSRTRNRAGTNKAIGRSDLKFESQGVVGVGLHSPVPVWLSAVWNRLW